MASSYMSITQTVSSKIGSGTNSFSSYTYYAKNSCNLATIRICSINPRLHLDQSHSNRKTLRHHIRAKNLESEREEKEDDEQDYRAEEASKEDYRAEEASIEDYRAEEATEEDYRAEEASKEDYRADEASVDDYRAEETVLKLYTNIKDRNINGISEVIGDECQCFSNFSSTNRHLRGKKQVMAFFYWLMMKLGKDIKIIVRPTSKDGMTVGVQWQLEWEKPHIQLGKGFSFHICHIYQGKLLIKNVEMFMEPIFHMEPLRLRTMAFVVSLAEKIVTYLRPAGNIRRQAMTMLLLALLLLAAAAFYFTRPGF